MAIVRGRPFGGGRSIRPGRPGQRPRPVPRVPEPEVVRQVELPGGPLDFILRQSTRARRLRVVIDPQRGVVVTVPASRAARGGGRFIEVFLAEREDWLRRHLERQAAERARIVARRPFEPGGLVLYLGQLHRLRIEPGSPGQRRSSVIRVGAADTDELIVLRAVADRRSSRQVLEAWLRDRARTAIQARVAEHAPALGVRPGAISIRDQRTRWGSAARSGRLSFSWRLILAPPDALDTVVIHELSHLRIFGHGPAFWELVASIRPDHVTWRRWLREHALELHGALGPDEPEVAAAS